MSKLATAMTAAASGRLGSALGPVLALSLLLSGCATAAKHPDRSVPAGGSSTGSLSPTAGPSSSSAAPCKQWSCVPNRGEQLGGGYTVRLWSSAAPTAVVAPDRSTPVLELLHDGSHQQWWVGHSGFGWGATLTCLPAGPAVPGHCVVLADVGSHAGSAELVLLRDGLLSGPPQASATFDAGRPIAADLDHDGWLDVLGTDNDYQPSYATGHNFWATYRFTGEALQRTGCAPRRTAAAAPPTTLLTGICPGVPQS